MNYKTHKLFLELDEGVVNKFFKFHAKNKHYYETIKRFAYEVKKSGRKRFGMQSIIERARWFSTIETNTVERFKINNDFASCYTRMLIIDDNSFDKFFMRRRTKCQK